ALEALKYAQDHSYLPGLLSVADQITTGLGGKDGGEFRAWLREDIGGLKISDNAQGKELIEAISRLGLPITTTNYDALIEDILARSPSTWTDSETAQLIIQGTISNVFHLHGYWEQPSSIIFGSMSYGELIYDASAAAIEQIIAGGRSLLFIGCGDGLEDPNFESLRVWLSRTFPASELRHYRLCLDHEQESLARIFEGERITPLSYGSSYDDLLPFLRDLAPSAEIAVAPAWALGVTVQQRAVEAIQVRVRTETVLAEHLADVETRTLNDILIPP